MARRNLTGTLAGAAAAALVCVLLAAGAAGAWSEFGERDEKPADPAVPVREPLFAWMLALSAGDSLGDWSGEAVRARIAATGRPSNFPLERVTGLARYRTDQPPSEAYDGAAVRAEWRISLDAALDMPLPYSILGYHPGSLRMAGELRLLELLAGDLTIDARGDEPRRVQVDTVRVWALEGGYMLLDADGLVDALLGPALDDSWVLGFATGRHRDKLLGVGVFTGRDGRSIFGEFDFAADKVLPHGGAEAAALSHASRRWLDPRLGRLPEPWREPPAAGRESGG